jgi:uncharacterized protein YkuJ
MTIWAHAFDNSKRHCWLGDLKSDSLDEKQKEHIVANPVAHGAVEWMRFIRKMNQLIPGAFGEPRFEKTGNLLVEVYSKDGETTFTVTFSGKTSKQPVLIECYDESLFGACDSVVEAIRVGYENAGKEGYSYAGLPARN